MSSQISTPSSADNPIVSLLKRVVPAPLKLAAKARWKQGRFSLRIPDRIFLEETAIPYFRELDEVKTVLDVGTDWYTWRYDSLFPEKEFYSIDFDPAKAKFASKNHTTGSLLELDEYFAKDQFDLILCNGVFGWGVNRPQDIRRAVEQLDRCLSSGGYLVVGWNDNDEHRPEGIESELENVFEPFVLPSLGENFFDTETAHRHLFRFYRAPEKPAHHQSSMVEKSTKSKFSNKV